MSFVTLKRNKFDFKSTVVLFPLQRARRICYSDN